MRRQAEVIVRSEIDDFPAIEARFGRALGFEHAQPLVSARALPCVDLFAQIGERIACHGVLASDSSLAEGRSHGGMSRSRFDSRAMAVKPVAVPATPSPAI